MIRLRDIEIGPERLMYAKTNALVLINNPMISRTGLTLRAATQDNSGAHARLAFEARQHAALLSALFPLFLLGRLGLAGDGARCLPSLSPLAGTEGLASL